MLAKTKCLDKLFKDVVQSSPFPALAVADEVTRLRRELMETFISSDEVASLATMGRYKKKTWQEAHKAKCITMHRTSGEASTYIGKVIEFGLDHMKEIRPYRWGRGARTMLPGSVDHMFVAGDGAQGRQLAQDRAPNGSPIYDTIEHYYRSGGTPT